MDYASKEAKRRALQSAKNDEMQLAFDLAGGMPWVAEQVANGAHLRDIARRIHVTYWWLSCYIEANPTCAHIIARARKFAASAKVAEAEEITDNLAGAGLLGLTPADVAAAKLRSDVRWKLAGKLDPEQFAEKKEGNSLNINVLHLDAVRAINAAPPMRALPAQVVEDADFTVMPVQDSGTDDEQSLTGEALS